MSLPARTAEADLVTAGDLMGAADTQSGAPSTAAPGVGPEEPSAADRRARSIEPRRSTYTKLGAPLLEGSILALTLPAAALLAAPIALGNWFVFGDRGRILFAQERVGRDGQTFRILKFRTMREVHEANFGSWGEGREQLRVTRFGRFLRNSHLDELPQLINILRGEMRLIGPRPEMIEINRWAQGCVPGFEQRTLARPGLTGLAQVSQGYVGRCAEGYSRKLELDLMHLERRSLRMDLAVLVRTATTMLRLRGWRWDPTPKPDAPSGAPRVSTPNSLWD